MMLHRNAHSSWLEGHNPAFLEEEIKKASWARSRKLKPWHHSLERQGQVEEDQASIELSARDAAALMLGTIISIAILGEMNMFLNHSKPSIFTGFSHISSFRNSRSPSEAQTGTPSQWSDKLGYYHPIQEGLYFSQKFQEDGSR